MQRRELLGVLGATAAGLVAMTGGEAHAAHLDKAHEDCLKACSDCAKTCDETFHHCYMQVAEGKRDHAKPLHLVSDCAGVLRPLGLHDRQAQPPDGLLVRRLRRSVQGHAAESRSSTRPR